MSYYVSGVRSRINGEAYIFIVEEQSERVVALVPFPERKVGTDAGMAKLIAEQRRAMMDAANIAAGLNANVS